MSFINAVYIVLKETLKAFFRIFTPIIIILILIVIIKIIYRYNKYGEKEFSVFRKKQETKFSEIIIDIVKKIDQNTFCLENENLYSDIVLINETGIYLLKIIPNKGIIVGNKNDKLVKNKIKNDLEIEINNPFYYLEKDMNKINSINNDLVINTILITNNNINVYINNIDKNKVISLQNFYYKIEKLLKNKKIYSKEQIEAITKLINHI